MVTFWNCRSVDSSRAMSVAPGLTSAGGKQFGKSASSMMREFGGCIRSGYTSMTNWSRSRWTQGTGQGSFSVL